MKIVIQNVAKIPAPVRSVQTQTSEHFSMNSIKGYGPNRLTIFIITLNTAGDNLLL